MTWKKIWYIHVFCKKKVSYMQLFDFSWHPPILPVTAQATSYFPTAIWNCCFVKFFDFIRDGPRVIDLINEKKNIPNFFYLSFMKFPHKLHWIWHKLTFNITTKFCSKSYKSDFVDVETLSTLFWHYCLAICNVR